LGHAVAGSRKSDFVSPGETDTSREEVMKGKPVRQSLLLSLLVGGLLAGCQSSGEVYGPPCAVRAYEAGYCPFPGYRAPVPQ
jgi:hypothetical protein